MEYVVEMLNITKKFSGIKANDNITLQVKKGEIHALLGENGAGKSTLMSVLFGIYQAEKVALIILRKKKHFFTCLPFKPHHTLKLVFTSFMTQ